LILPVSRAHFSIAVHDQNNERPGPRSTTGRGISGNLRWYSETAFRNLSPTFGIVVRPESSGGGIKVAVDA
jgi:hypothetical protein